MYVGRYLTLLLNCELASSVIPDIVKDCPKICLRSFENVATGVLTGLCTEHGMKYTIYLISVTKQYCGCPDVEKWDIWRRYSDFHDFHMLLQEKVTVSLISCKNDGDNIVNLYCMNSPRPQCP